MPNAHNFFGKKKNSLDISSISFLHLNTGDKRQCGGDVKNIAFELHNGKWARCINFVSDDGKIKFRQNLLFKSFLIDLRIFMSYGTWNNSYTYTVELGI